jgi:hypothetical protein
VIEDIRFELKLATRAIHKAVHARDCVGKWSVVADAYLRRAEAWRQLAQHEDDQVHQQAFTLSASHDVATARLSRVQGQQKAGVR